MRRSISSAILTLYACMGLLGIAHIVHMQNMDMPMNDCPFAQGHDTVCSMDTDEHLSVLKKLFGVPLPLAAILVFFSILPFFKIVTTQNVSRRRPGPMTLYQQLYSRGILNPKLH